MGVAGEFAWPDGARAALSLTFDGGYPEHYELVAPLLHDAGLRGTFFVNVPSLLENPEAWKQVVMQGQEIGSHSLFGVTTNGELRSWTLDMVRDDLRMTDKGIVELVGCPVTSFALAGESTLCSDGDYSAILQRQFSSVRSATSGQNPADSVDLFHVQSHFWQDLVGPIEAYLPVAGSWSVVVFDRFFGPGFDTAEEDLRILIARLSAAKDIWVAPFGEVAEYIANARGTLQGVTSA